MALLRFHPFRALSRPVPVAAPFRRTACVTGPDDLVTSGRVTIEVNAGPDTTTVVIRGELDLVTAPVLGEQLRGAVANKPERLVLDMAGTGFMDCGCARLIAAARSALPADANLTIRQPSRSVRRVLELTGLNAYCEIQR